jgi:hypothetical protein
MYASRAELLNVSAAGLVRRLVALAAAAALEPAFGGWRIAAL